MSDTTIDHLTKAEMLTLAGLVRKLIGVDGRFTDEERQALRAAADTIAEDDATKPIGAYAFFQRIEEAAAAYPDDAAVRAAAIKLTRQEAREIVHAILFDVAASDGISLREGDLLGWIERVWQIATPEPVE